MDNLPAELLDLIVQQCDHASLKQVRLVNSQFEEISSPLVFEHFYMGYFEHSILHLCNLARSRQARHVRKLTMCSDILPKWDYHQWTRHIDFRPDYTAWQQKRLYEIQSACREYSKKGKLCSKCLNATWQLSSEYDTVPRHSLGPEQRKLGFRQFDNLRKSQSALVEDEEGIMLKEYFARLPHVQKVTVKPTTPFQGKTNEWPVWKRLRQRIYVGPDQWMYDDQNEADFLSDESERPDHSFYHQARLEELRGQPLLWMLGAIGYRSQFSGTNQIAKLELQYSHIVPLRNLMGKYANSGVSEYDREARFQTIAEGFGHARDLTLEVPHAAESELEFLSAMRDEVVELLLAAMNLESLRLVFGDDELAHGGEQMDYDLTNTLGVGGSIHWPHLQHLALCTKVRAASFLEFLRRHSGTLNSLEMRDMELEDVHRVFYEIPQILKLKHVYAECVWGEFGGDREGWSCYMTQSTDNDAPYEKSIKAYLLGQTDELPKMKDEGGWGDEDEDASQGGDVMILGDEIAWGGET